jgi:hypothetical protein
LPPSCFTISPSSQATNCGAVISFNSTQYDRIAAHQVGDVRVGDHVLKGAVERVPHRLTPSFGFSSILDRRR